MKTIVKIKFWSFLFAGITLLFLGAYLFITKSTDENVTAMIIGAGVIQLVFFYLALFYLYKGKLKNAIDD